MVVRRRSLIAGALTALPLITGRQSWAARTPGAGLGVAPAPLNFGSRIAAVAPGTWLEPADPLLDRLRRRCTQQGWTLLTPTELFGRWRWFSARDASRAAALERAWQDTAVDALFCVGAGWGSARVLEHGWSPPPSPRWCVGFSDCSALLLAQLAAGSLGGIHAWFGREEAEWQRLAALLRGEAVPPLRGQGAVAGVTRGRLVVTNLTIATSLIGTPWWPNLQGSILVLEDTGEAPYRVDRQLTQWRAAGVLEGVAGIGLGRFSWSQDDVLPGDFSMEEILLERLRPLGIPIVTGLPVGHGQPNLALPLGVLARLDGTRGQLSLLG